MSDQNQQQEEVSQPVPTEFGACMTTHESETTDTTSETKTLRNADPRPFKPRQFLFGLALSTGGIGLMLFVAAGALHDVGAGGAISLPATGLCMILGLMMLGGGFGQMAISSPRFDDTEFQRMLNGEMPDDDDDDDTHTFHSSSHKSASGRPSDTDLPQKSDDSTEVQPKADVVTDGSNFSAEASATTKRSQSETNDNFVSTVLSDVVASHG